VRPGPLDERATSSAICCRPPYYRCCMADRLTVDCRVLCARCSGLVATIRDVPDEWQTTTTIAPVVGPAVAECDCCPVTISCPRCRYAAKVKSTAAAKVARSAVVPHAHGGRLLWLDPGGTLSVRPARQVPAVPAGTGSPGWLRT
jgi:hypothetical protein